MTRGDGTAIGCERARLAQLWVCVSDYTIKQDVRATLAAPCFQVILAEVCPFLDSVVPPAHPLLKEGQGSAGRVFYLEAVTLRNERIFCE